MPSDRPGMGAQLFDDGVTFRVWAPFASAVSVVGEFNDWAFDTSPLESEANGYWSTHVPQAQGGQRYKYLVVNGASGNGLYRNDPYALGLTRSDGDSVILDQPRGPAVDGYDTPARHEVVIYEVHVGTFTDDPEGSGERGTFWSLIDRLDYLRDLGINAIQVMPSTEFPTDISNGYNPSAIFALESSYGGLQGFLRLVQEAHARGIAVIGDVVYNHLGTADLDLWQFDGWSENDQGGIYFYNDDRRTTPWGDSRPDYGRPEVRQFLRDNALYWYEGLGVDGLRWDATSWIRNAEGRDDLPDRDLPDGWRLMQDVQRELRERQPWKLSIAEDMHGNPFLTRDSSQGGAGFDAQWDVEFVQTTRRLLIAGSDDERDVFALQRALERQEDTPFARVVFTESHDEVTSGEDPNRARLPWAVAPDDPSGYFARKRSTLGAVLMLTARGIPMLFQGQEFLTTAPFHAKSRLDWSDVDAQEGIVLLYRDLIRLRRNWYDHTRGLRGAGLNVFHVNPQEHVIAFHRWEQGGPRDDVVVIVNLSNQSFDSYRLGFPRGGQWRVRFNSDASIYSGDFGNAQSPEPFAEAGARDGLAFEGEVGLGPYSALILSQEE